MRVLEHLPEQTSVVFADEDGWEDSADYSRGEGKLGWRVELAARWKALGVTFEPFGKDHTPVAAARPTPLTGWRGGLRLPGAGPLRVRVDRAQGPRGHEQLAGYRAPAEGSPQDNAPGAVRRIILGRDPARRFDIDLEGGFPRFMDEYRAETGEPYVPFTHLVTVAQTVGEDTEAAAQMLRRGGTRRRSRPGWRMISTPATGPRSGLPSRCGWGCSSRRG